uniref:Uncharacterized protein n=1 Tax=Oryza sativa subsp. japonica TaxID=39947 RepID=Q2QX15_ORYSJ|nr:hypothetical protein LOC_Os12g07510 [Oryza sativa Japonica Group]
MASIWSLDSHGLSRSSWPWKGREDVVAVAAPLNAELVAGSGKMGEVERRSEVERRQRGEGRGRRQREFIVEVGEWGDTGGEFVAGELAEVGGTSTTRHGWYDIVCGIVIARCHELVLVGSHVANIIFNQRREACCGWQASAVGGWMRVWRRAGKKWEIGRGGRLSLLVTSRRANAGMATRGEEWGEGERRRARARQWLRERGREAVGTAGAMGGVAAK